MFRDKLSDATSVCVRSLDPDKHRHYQDQYKLKSSDEAQAQIPQVGPVAVLIVV